MLKRVNCIVLYCELRVYQLAQALEIVIVV